MSKKQKVLSIILKALLLNLPLVGLVLTRYLSSISFSPPNVFYLIFIGFGYYLIVLFALNLPSILLSYFRKISLLLFWLITSLFLYYLVLDSIVYNIYRFHINLFFIELFFIDFENFGFTTGILMLGIGVLTFVFFFEYYIIKYAQKMKGRFLYLLIPAFLMFVFSQIIHIYAFANDRTDITSISPRLPLYFPITSSSFVKKHDKIGKNLGLGDKLANVSKENSSINYPKKQISSKIEKDNLPNIIYIVLESWRFDMMDSIISPNIYKFSKKSIYAKKHFSTGNSTTSGIFGMFYGIHPTYWDAVKANSSIIDNPVLIDILKENNYSIGVFTHSNFTRFKLSATIFNGIDMHEKFKGNKDWEKDEDMNNRFINFIEENKTKPFFGFIFYTSTHHSYSYPENREKFSPAGKINMGLVNNNTNPKPYINAYKNAINFVDSMVNEIVISLNSNNIDAKTIVIITSDHGEEFNDNGENYWGHGSNFTKYQTNVPLIMYLPDKSPRQINIRTSHIDIAPTLIQEVFKVEDNIDYYCNGKNIFSLSNDIRPLVSASYVNHALIIGEDVFAVYPFSLKKYKVYDINGKVKIINQSLFREGVNEMNWFYKKY